MNQPNPDSDNAALDNGSQTEPSGQLNRIVKRMGGRHLIFRTKTGGWWFLPKPYVLISSFRGPVWAFYGIGQIWITHQKLREIGGWMARVPRFGSTKLVEVVNSIESELIEFIEYCNELGIEGTIVLERKVIEFHWTFGYELVREKQKPEHTQDLEPNFKRLVDAFLAAKKKLF